MSEAMKTIAMYLPQFHRVAENDAWWGEGFTDWVAVKGAEKLYEGHYQPHEPLDDNYYDLMNKDTMQWQAELAKEYGISGFCFYHYYFKDGRKILEKPAQNLLEWTDIGMPFCFCWANETWARTWTKINKGNPWAEKFEEVNKQEKETTGILLEQKYGREKEWEAHFKYLLPFFRDKRYIRVNHCPIFLIYRPGDISCLAEMTYCWKNLARKNGIEDIYIIGLNMKQKKAGLDAVLLNGPGMYLPWEDVKTDNGVKSFAYETVWKQALDMKPIEGCRTYFGAIQNYDDTPRRGKNGTVLQDASPEIFQKYLYLLAEKNRETGNELLFINAWNEWGEGNHLEPDKRDGYAYLEATKRVVERLREESGEEIHVQEGLENNVCSGQETGKNSTETKFEEYFHLFDVWMSLREKNVNLDKYLLKYGYRNIAVYGLGIFAKHFMKELDESEVQIVYAIDRNKEIKYPDLAVKSLEQELPKVDAIIVTTVYEFDHIWRELKNKVDYPIISLAEIIKEC